MTVTGKVVLVTGAARGIGLGTAQVLVRGGAKVVLADRLPEVAGAASALGSSATSVCCDVSTPEANQEMVAEALRAFGRVDALVASAAASRRSPFLEVSAEDLDFTLSASMYGVFYSCQAAARQMAAQGSGGSLVIISSVHVHQHYPNSSAYNMAKAAIGSLARTIASELAPHRIRVNTILPGWTYTPGELEFYTEEELRRGGETIPAGRLAMPEDLGQAALYLLSEEAAYVTGAELLVDGGISLTRAATGR